MAKPRLHIRVKDIVANIQIGDEKIGEICFDLFDLRSTECNHDNPNLDPADFLTSRRRLRSPIAKAFGQQRKVNSMLIDTGTWIGPAHHGNRYGRDAMDEFLRRWSPMADLVVGYVKPIQGDSGPPVEKISSIWREVGFIPIGTSGRLLAYLPKLPK